MEPYENFDPKDLLILSYTSKPSGGLVHRVPQGIRAIHLPTGTVVTCEAERSQHRNRHLALTELWQKVQGKPSYEELQAQIEQLQQDLSAEQEMVSNYHDTNSALAAQVMQLRKPLSALVKACCDRGGFLESDGQFAYKVKEWIFKYAKTALEATPAQCLAEHDYNIAKNAFINGVNYAKKRPDVILHKVIEMVAGDYAYGEQLRQQAKGE